MEQSKLEKYIREQMQKTGRFSNEDIEKVVKTLLSTKCLQSEEAVDAFIKASQ